jgi:cytochrome-b5 reductase
VYNVTEYARDHPGGNDVLLEVAGTDATSAYEDIGHSEDAGEIMHGLLVGVLEGATQETKSTEPTQMAKVVINRTTPEENTSTKKSLLSLRTEIVLLATGAAGLSYLLNSYHLLGFLATSTSNTSQTLSGHGSFTRGFMTATTAIGVAVLLGAGYLAKLLNSEKTFDTYPAHIQSSQPKTTFRPNGVLDPSAYQKFRLRHKEELSDGVYRFVFDLPTKYSVLGLPIGQHVAIKATLDEHTVVRSYTPISNNRDLGRLELLIRVYPKGLMGNYLKNLSIGDYAEIRGPKGAMKYKRGMNKEIGMVGGGTGITPLYQVIRAICEDDKDETRISLVYGNRSQSDIMLREKIDAFARKVPHKLKVYYTLDQPDESWNGGRGHITKDMLKEMMPVPGPDSKVMLCGPPGMVNAVKKNLAELGYESPGAVSKMSDQIFCF